MTPDVNLLVAASRSDHVHHRLARGWLAETIAAAAAGASLTLMPLVVASYLRIATNRRIFADPMPIDTALAFIDTVMKCPGVELATLGEEWAVLRGLCIAHQLTGNALPDAWLAAAVMHQGEHLVTFDAGFKKLLPRHQLTVLPTA